LEAHPEDVPAPPIFRAERSYLFSLERRDGPAFRHNATDKATRFTNRTCAGQLPSRLSTLMSNSVSHLNIRLRNRRTYWRASRRPARSENFTLERVLQFERCRNRNHLRRETTPCLRVDTAFPSSPRPFSTRAMATPFIGGSRAGARLRPETRRLAADLLLRHE
jgi:hypothetical protein